MVLLEDGISVGVAYDLKAMSAEARPDQFIDDLHDKITRLISKVLPRERENPWVMQFFVQDELSLNPLYDSLEKYVETHNSLDDPLAQKYLEVMKEHFELLCQPEGLFNDPMSNIAFKGKMRRIRMLIYRRYDTKAKVSREQVIEELTLTAETVESRVKQAGIKLSRMNGERFYRWMVKWFNPNPQLTNGDVDKLLEKKPYPKDKPYGWSPSQNIFYGSIEPHEGGWCFDGIQHKVMTFSDLSQSVSVGALSREMVFGEDERYAILDKLPVGAIYTISLSFEAKEDLETHLDSIEGASIGKSDTIIGEIKANVARARYEIENKHYLVRSCEAIYYRAENNRQARIIEGDLRSLLDAVNLSLYDADNERFPQDLYLRFLPFNFNYHFDKKHNKRSSYKYASDVAKLLPLYGRSQGDGENPLNIFFNRGGEPFVFDQLSRSFKTSNSHMAIIGTTGAGKSVTLNNMMLSLSAVHNPRIVAMEVGGSFDLLAKYLQRYGRNVTVMKFDRLKPIPVNPYAESDKALALIEAEERAIAALNKSLSIDGLGATEEAVLGSHIERLSETLASKDEMATEEELQCEEDRDILNEMVLATRVMITQGNPKEEEKLDPTDSALITRALVHAMKSCKKNGVRQMILSHVIESMQQLSDAEKNMDLQARLKRFALRLEYYTTGIRGQFINRESEPLADFDFLHVDFGFMQSESYKDLMNVVSISLLSKVLALAEANKATMRPTKLFIDESHVFLKSLMVAAFIILMAKVARKLGLWIIPCTQNLEDFSTIESKKILSMMETWLCLALEANEVELIKEFKSLSDEVQQQILSVRKYPGIYSEGVLVGKRHSGLFRNIPPRIALSLAMTEQDERAERQEIQTTHQLDELEAVEYMANNLRIKPRENNYERQFMH